MPGEANQAWRPRTTLEALRERAHLYTSIRRFFAEREVLEVDTPTLSRAAVTDPNIESFATHYRGPGTAAAVPLFLNTSPEFAMKRLLAGGAGPIYQIAHVFRQGERGRRHHPEFSMLEWYRPGSDHVRLMDEVEELMTAVLPPLRGRRPALRLSYREAMLRYAHVDCDQAPVSDLAVCAQRHGIATSTAVAEAGRDVWLELLMSQVVEPQLPSDRLVFVQDFPPSQAALARIRPGEPPVAERFEVYLDGMELANGFHELADPHEQRRRFEADLERRAGQGQGVVPMDEQFLEALAAGLPDCAGVAVGLDRILMLRIGTTHIDEVLAFPLERA